jgi:4-amino-4-deoxy-L-arabinose transferase-like glycosyltransferase
VNGQNVREYCRTHYVALAALVLGLAAFNLTYRLDREFVTEWDESLYALSAWEMADRGDWIGVTMFGNFDYSNTKPPLNVWLLIISFKLFGRGLFALRLASALSAWLTILALVEWSRRRFDPFFALVAGAVLATTFGFFHVHSGRTANTDALFTLFVTLVVIVLSAEERRPWQRLWLGPALAGAFMTRGMAFLMPLTIVIIVDAVRRREWRQRLAPTAFAVALFVIPVMTWAQARYRLDGWAFFAPMFEHDFINRTVRALDEHSGGPLYYLGILAKHQYDWLAVCVIAAIVCPRVWTNVRARLLFTWGDNGLRSLIAAWAACTLLIPTVMATKVPWYLNTFYPLFAVAVAALVVYAFDQITKMPGVTARLGILTAAVLLGFAIAEAKLWAYSFGYRDLSHSAQGLLLAEADRLAGRRVYRDRFDRSATFVAGIVGAELRPVSSYSEFLRVSRRGDFLLLSTPNHWRHKLRMVRSNHGNWLLVRRSQHSASGARDAFGSSGRSR